MHARAAPYLELQGRSSQHKWGSGGCSGEMEASKWEGFVRQLKTTISPSSRVIRISRPRAASPERPTAGFSGAGPVGLCIGPLPLAGGRTNSSSRPPTAAAGAAPAAPRDAVSQRLLLKPMRLFKLRRALGVWAGVRPTEPTQALWGAQGPSMHLRGGPQGSHSSQTPQPN